MEDKKDGANSVRSNDLLCCPFCGSQPTFIDDTSYGDCQIFCECEAAPCVVFPVYEVDKAKDVWNHRAT